MSGVRPALPGFDRCSHFGPRTKPNALRQMDIMYVRIPTSGWWYAATVIDYHSRYLLALHLTPSCCATEVTAALKLARAEGLADGA